MLPLAVFPDDEQLCRIKDRRIGATNQPDQQDDNQILDGGATKEQ